MHRRGSLLFWSSLALACSGCFSQADLQQASRFQSALDSYEKARTPEEYRQVGAAYQEIIDGGVVSGGLLYNQGNAYLRAGDKARAIACYRHAQRYRPRDAQLQASLSNALGADAIAPKKPLLQHVFFWQDWLSYPEKFQLTMFLAVVTVGLAVARLRFNQKALKWCAAGFLGASALAAVSATYDWYRFDHIMRGIVTTNKVEVRKGDGETYSPAFNAPLTAGTEFIVLESRGSWIHIQLSEDNHGWIPLGDAATY